MLLKKASDITPRPLSATTHEDFVAKDAERIFHRMLGNCETKIQKPRVFVLHSPDDIERLPPCPGVYIAFCERGVCQYVGESACVGRRVGSFGSRVVLRYAKYLAVVPTIGERQRRAMEMYYIGLLSPVFNKQLRDQGKHVVVHFHDLAWIEVQRLWMVRGSGTLLDGRGRSKAPRRDA